MRYLVLVLLFATLASATGVEFEVGIGQDGIESGVYGIEVGPANARNVTLDLHFEQVPLRIVLKEGGEKVPLFVEFEDESGAQYAYNFILNDERVFELEYAVENQGEGVLDKRFEVASPVQFYVVEDGRYSMLEGVSYSGEFRAERDAINLRCALCSVEGRLARFEGSPGFSVVWNEKVLPFRSGYLYLALVFAVLLFGLLSLRRGGGPSQSGGKKM